RMFVLAVGVNKYMRKDLQLKYAVQDASTVAEALAAVARKQVQGSPMFADVTVTTLLDAKATKREIAAEFDRLKGIVKARDVFVLFLAGHGKVVGREGWFYIPQDLDTGVGQRIETHGIGRKELEDWIVSIPSQKRLIILDACESGARSLTSVRETFMAQLEHATGDSWLTAAPEGFAAFEGYKGHGVLTYAILEALHRTDGEEPISVFGMAAHVSRAVPTISLSKFNTRQVPRFTPSGD